MHLKEIIKTNHVQLKSSTSHQWFTHNVSKSEIFRSFLQLASYKLTSAIDKRMRRSVKIGQPRLLWRIKGGQRAQSLKQSLKCVILAEKLLA